MSITAIREGETLRIIRKSDAIPEGRELEFFSADEIDRLVAERVWRSLPAESRDDMLFQTQSRSYSEWMQEEEWETPSVKESLADSLPLAEFKP